MRKLHEVVFLLGHSDEEDGSPKGGSWRGEGRTVDEGGTETCIHGTWGSAVKKRQLRIPRRGDRPSLKEANHAGVPRTPVRLSKAFSSVKHNSVIRSRQEYLHATKC
ncbi:UNVERIFIED_CONTAM: hypothetical protein K2H54_030986 [Gekko kuhli]